MISSKKQWTQISCLVLVVLAGRRKQIILIMSNIYTLQFQYKMQFIPFYLINGGM